ncbi:hypothetical protein [Crateriforma spongiae]|uniref:hypothetical protein n=1 Tax=Crateriforma spongiae TaxID=2724528 RepID=UPI001445F03D|nr:hypothetical protein [Crateriforma spongiae]
MALARLVGSFTIVGLTLATVLIVAGYGDGGGLTYGDTTLTDPTPMQIGAMLIAISATLLPPWYALQRAFADNHAVHRSGGSEFSDG